MVSPHESPAHFSVSGNFSEDDIQHLLGAMIESHAPTQQHQEQQEKQEVIETTSVASSLSVAVAAEIDEESRALARSERKRSREKQRRLDVNKQFTDLTKLISQLEKEEREEDPTVFRQSFSATNRADLICRTIAHLERLRDTNKRRRTECSSLQEQLQAAKKAGEDMAEKCKGLVSSSQNMMMPQPNKQVMMMVPMMMPADGTHAVPQFGMQAQMNAAMNPFMMPQQFMAPATATQQHAPAVANQQQQQQHSHVQQPQQQQARQQQPQQPQPQQHGMQFTMQAQPQMQMMFPNMQQPFVPGFVNPMAAAASSQHQGQQHGGMPFFNPNGAMSAHMQAPSTMLPSAAPTQAASESAGAAAPNGSSGNGSEQANPPGTSNSNGGSNYAHCA